MRALLRVSGDPDPVDSEALGYRLGPRLNAAGRLDDAGKGVRLMMTDDPAEADRLAEELDALNTERRAAEQQLVKAAQAQAAGHDFIGEKALIVRGRDWHVGVIGLAAGRLCQQYYCPTCVLSEHEGLLHGSLRSIPGVHIHECLKTCDDLLLRYGGHEQAAGVTLEADRYEAFCERLQSAVGRAEESCFVPAQPYDAELTLSDCTDALLDEINRMAPFGCGNPAPLFLARGLRPEERRAVGAEGAHLKLTLRQGGRMLGGIAFSQGALAATLPDEVDAVFSLGRNTFRGVTSLQLDVRALKPVREACAQALEAPDGPAERDALVTALADAFSMQAGKTLSDTESIQESDWPALEAALREGRRGHLLAARTHASARRALALADMDVCAHAPDDPRGFVTLLTAPTLAADRRTLAARVAAGRRGVSGRGGAVAQPPAGRAGACAAAQRGAQGPGPRRGCGRRRLPDAVQGAAQRHIPHAWAACAGGGAGGRAGARGAARLLPAGADRLCALAAALHDPPGGQMQPGRQSDAGGPAGRSGRCPTKRRRKGTMRLSRPNGRSMLLLHGTLLIYAVVSVFAKLAGLRLAAQDAGMTLAFLAAEAAALLAYSLLWQLVLRRMPLSFAYSNKGVCTLWTALFGLAFFGEQMTWGKAAGLVVVLAGVALVVTDHE